MFQSTKTSNSLKGILNSSKVRVANLYSTSNADSHTKMLGQAKLVNVAKKLNIYGV